MKLLTDEETDKRRTIAGHDNDRLKNSLTLFQLQTEKFHPDNRVIKLDLRNLEWVIFVCGAGRGSDFTPRRRPSMVAYIIDLCT